MKDSNYFFKSLKNCHQLTLQVEMIAKMPASIKNAKAMRKKLDMALKEFKSLEKANLFFNFCLEKRLKEIEEQLICLFGKAQDLFIEAWINDLVSDCLSIKTKHSERLFHRKLNAFLKNYRLSKEQKQKLSSAIYFSKRDCINPILVENSIEEGENLLEAIFLVAEQVGPYAQAQVDKLSLLTKKTLDEELSALGQKDLLTCPQLGALALLRTFSFQQGVKGAKKPGMPELKAFLKERKKAAEEEKSKKTNIFVLKAI